MRPQLCYKILANPAAGPMTENRRRPQLKRCAEILRADIHGLDTRSARELAQCARELAQHCDVLVVAGGDGTLSRVINAVDLNETVLAFLPFGTGNAVTHALRYPGSLTAIAARIRNGTIHHYDLIDCDGRKKAFMTSLGLDGTAIRLYESYRFRGYRGLNAHARAVLKAFFKTYRPTGGHISIDGDYRPVAKLISLVVVKQPYFGMGLKVVPKACWNDGRIHSVLLKSGLTGLLAGLITGFTIGNRAGKYSKGKAINVVLNRSQFIQIDGEAGWQADRFSFNILKNVLRLKH